MPGRHGPGRSGRTGRRAEPTGACARRVGLVQAPFQSRSPACPRHVAGGSSRSRMNRLAQAARDHRVRPSRLGPAPQQRPVAAPGEVESGPRNPVIASELAPAGRAHHFVPGRVVAESPGVWSLIATLPNARGPQDFRAIRGKGDGRAAASSAGDRNDRSRRSLIWGVGDFAGDQRCAICLENAGPRRAPSCAWR
jgi:hypothetical protein